MGIERKEINQKLNFIRITKAKRKKLFWDPLTAIILHGILLQITILLLCADDMTVKKF